MNAEVELDYNTLRTEFLAFRSIFERSILLGITTFNKK